MAARCPSNRTSSEKVNRECALVGGVKRREDKRGHKMADGARDGWSHCPPDEIRHRGRAEGEKKNRYRCFFLKGIVDVGMKRCSGGS